MGSYTAYAGAGVILAFVLAGTCTAQAGGAIGSQAAVLPAAMILPRVAAAASSSSEYPADQSSGMQIEGVGGYNQPYAVRRRREEAYCSTRGLASDSLAFGQCVAEVDAALFERQFPLR